MRRLVIVMGMLAGIATVTGCDNQMVEEKRYVELSAESIELLDIDTDSGDAIIQGDEQAAVIKVEATISRSKNVDADDIILTLEKQGNTAKLITDEKSGFAFRDVSKTITVTVPSRIKLKIKDDSGDLSVKNMQSSVEVHDLSGDIVISDVTGELSIEDNSGDIRITGAPMIKEIQDEAGDIAMDNTGGNTEIDDESGNLKIVNHNGSLSIKDGSGDITVDSVAGDVIIKEDGSGEKVISNVKGTYTAK